MPKINKKSKDDPNLVFEQILSEVKSGQTKTVYLLHGEDHRLIRQFQSELLKILIPNEVRAGNYIIFEEKNFSVQDIMDFCDTVPFLASRRVVLLENCPILQINKKIKNLSDTDQDIFLTWLKNNLNLDSTFTLLFVSYDEIDKRKVNSNKLLYKIIQQYGKICECPVPKDIYSLTNALSAGNRQKALQQLDKLIRSGMDNNELSYGLMFWLRQPFKDELIGKTGFSKKRFTKSELLKIYLNSMETEDKLRPRYQDLFSENPRNILERWIFGIKVDTEDDHPNR